MRANKRAIRLAAILLATGAMIASAAQSPTEIAGAGAAAYPNGTMFNTVAVQAMQFGLGATADVDGLVAGDLHATLLGTTATGQPRRIAYDATVTGISPGEGSATLVGIGTLNMGDGTPPLVSVPVTMTVTRNTVQMFLGTTSLPQTTLTQGSVAIK